MFKKIKGFISKSLLLLFVALSFSQSVFAYQQATDRNGNPCRLPADYSAAIGNQPDTKMLPPCGGYLQDYDRRFIFWASYFVPRESIEKEREFLTSKGLNVDKTINQFPQTTPFDGWLGFAFSVTVLSLTFYFIAGLVVLSSTGKSFLRLISTGFALTAVMLTVFASDTFKIKIVAYSVGQVNKVYSDMYRIEDILAAYDSKYQKDFTGSESSIVNENLNSFLMEKEIENTITEISIFKDEFADRKKSYEINFSPFDLDDPTVQEKLDIVTECASIYFMDVSNDWEFNLWSDEKFYSISHSGTLLYGGNSDDWECEETGFGNRKAHANIKIDSANALTNFTIGTDAVNMSQDPTFIENYQAVFNDVQGVVTQVMSDTDKSASIAAASIDEMVSLAKAATEASITQSIRIQDVAEYQQLKDIHKGFMKPLKYENQDNLTVEEYLHLLTIAKEQYKFSILAGAEIDKDENTEVLINGHYFLRKHYRDVVYDVLNYECATKSSQLEYDNRVKFADEFNSPEVRDAPAEDLSQLGARNEFECYKMEDGFMIALGNPAEKEELWKKQQISNIAMKNFWNAIDEAAYEISSENQDMFEDVKLEIINNVRPTAEGLYKFKFSQIDLMQGVNRTLNAQQNMISFTNSNTASYRDPSRPDYYFMFERVTKDYIDEEKKAVIADTRSLAKHDFSTVLTPMKFSKTHGAKEELGLWDQLGYGKFIEEMFVAAECPIRNVDGDCTASFLQQSYANSKGLVPTFLSVGAIRLTITGFVGVCNGADSVTNELGDAGIIGKALGTFGGTILKLGCLPIQAIESAFGSYIDLLLLLMIILMFLNFLTMNSFVLLDFFLLFYFIRVIPTMIIMLSVVFPYELGRNSFVAASSQNPEKDFMQFDSTFGLLKGLFFYIILVPFTVYMFLFLINSGELGGVVYDSTRAMFDDTFIQNIVFGLVQPFFNILGVMFSVKVVGEWEDQMKQILNVKGEGMFKGQSALVSAAYAYVVGTAMKKGRNEIANSTKGLSGYMKDKYENRVMKQFATSKGNGGGNGSGNGSGTPNNSNSGNGGSGGSTPPSNSN